MLPAAEAAEVAEVVLPIIIQAAAGDKADAVSYTHLLLIAGMVMSMALFLMPKTG